MEDATAADSLFSIGVLTAEGGEVTTTDRFESTVEENVARADSLSIDDLTESVRELVERGGVVEPLAELCDEDPRTMAELWALDDSLDSSADGWLSLLPVLRLFRPTRPPTRGVPEPFIPVPATHVPYLTRIYSPAVVYVWLDDCPPCETVREDLESMFEEPRELVPFAVYGPDDKEFLAEVYGVTAGPALLFMREGSVDSRLYGAQPRRTVESELATLGG